MLPVGPVVDAVVPEVGAVADSSAELADGGSVACALVLVADPAPPAVEPGAVVVVTEPPGAAEEEPGEDWDWKLLGTPTFWRLAWTWVVVGISRDKVAETAPTTAARAAKRKTRRRAMVRWSSDGAALAGPGVWAVLSGSSAPTSSGKRGVGDQVALKMSARDSGAETRPGKG